MQRKNPSRVLTHKCDTQMQYCYEKQNQYPRLKMQLARVYEMQKCFN